MDTELRVEVDHSAVYEVLLSLFAFTRPNDFGPNEGGQSRFGNRRPAYSPELRRVLERLGGRHGTWEQLLGLAWQTPTARSVDAFLRRIEETEPIELLLHLAGFYSESYPAGTRAAIEAASNGDGTARTALPQTLYPLDPQRQAAVSHLLALNPSEISGLIAAAVHHWHEEVFEPCQAAGVPLLAADAEARRALLSSSPELLIRITTGVRYVPRPWIETVLLIPSHVLRPWLLAVDYKQMRIYCYAVADDPPDRPDLPSAQLVKIFQALGDATRLRLARTLAQGPLTLRQLCEVLGEPESVLRHHLAILRAARLIGLTCGEETTHQLHSDLLNEIAQPLARYLALPLAGVPASPENPTSEGPSPG